MGRWSLYLEGEGQHHTGSDSRDADTLARHLVTALREAGHDIDTAHFQSGATEDLKHEDLEDQKARVP